MEACQYDGAGSALQHIYSNALSPRTKMDPGSARQYDQRPYFPSVWPGLADSGYIYAPPECMSGSILCRLHIVFHGCGMHAGNPQMNTSYVLYAGYNEWAASNGIVVLYPQSGGFPEHHINGSQQQNSGCWDSYGQQQGPGGNGLQYATKNGGQMLAVRNMIRAIAGF